MYIIYGQKRYGTCEAVPGLWSVQTDFFHIYFIPVFPMGSYVVFDSPEGEDEENIRVSPISMHWRSVGKTWLLSSSLIFILLGLSLVFGKTAEIKVLGALALMFGFGGFFLSQGLWSVASYEDARLMAETIGLDARGMVYLDLAFERITEAEAEEVLSQFAEEQAAAEAERKERMAELKREKKEAAAQNMKRNKALAPKVQEKKRCLDCNRLIRAAAKTCKHCGAST